MKQRRLYYVISFTEGAAVMATEIIGAKYLAPLFGSSLYVWSSVMAMTLGGLAAGYFYGGRLSQKVDVRKILFLTLLSAGSFIIAMPLIISLVTTLGLSLPLLAGVVICSFFILVPPVFCMGMVSPLIVQLSSGAEGNSGRRAGEVYAISTVGGILATFLTGFYLIPAFGLSVPLFVFGGLLILPALIYFIKKRKGTNGPLLFFVLVLIMSTYNSISHNRNEGTVLYECDGMLGKLEVVEKDWDMDSLQQEEHHRLLLGNNIIQSWTETKTGRSYLKYVEQLEHLTKALHKDGQKALVLGLGGGNAVNVLAKGGYKVTAVELDERIIEIARKYFDLDPNTTVICDDARHAIENMCEKYDLIFVDLFHGEVTPSHVMSIESITKMKTLLNKDGVIAFNTYGYIKPPAGLGNVSLLKTIEKSGFNKYRICRSGEIEKEDFRNLMIIASVSEVAFSENELTDKIALEDGNIITDDRPVLEAQNALAAKNWRSYYVQNFIRAREK